MRKNPLLFKQEEFEFLHRIYLSQNSKAKFFQSIQKKNGVGLNKDEIMFVKKKFVEWKSSDSNELLWMNQEE